MFLISGQAAQTLCGQAFNLRQTRPVNRRISALISALQKVINISPALHQE
jgi:hypothetical protein